MKGYRYKQYCQYLPPISNLQMIVKDIVKDIGIIGDVRENWDRYGYIFLSISFSLVFISLHIYLFLILFQWKYYNTRLKGNNRNHILVSLSYSYNHLNNTRKDRKAWNMKVYFLWFQISIQQTGPIFDLFFHFYFTSIGARHISYQILSLGS